MMPDREKVIERLTGLKELLKLQKDILGYGSFIEDINDALALLKEQEKATVISIHRNGFGSRVGACPNCKSVLHYEYNQSFCGKCGQEVKWE